MPFNLGNYAQVDNVYSQPDISLVGTIPTPTISPFNIVKLYDRQTTTPGASNGTPVGNARSRSFEYKSGTVGATTAIYHHYLFDVTMFTSITLTANTTLSDSALITSSTGATGAVSYTHLRAHET